MRSLSSNERRLLFLMCGAVFVALNLMGMRMISAASSAQKQREAALRAEIAERKDWILVAETIEPEAVDVPDPPALGQKGATSSLLSELRAAVGQDGLIVVEESLPPPPEGLPEKAVSLRLKLSGPFTGLVRFLFNIQQPGQWRSVEQLIIKADPIPQNVLAEMEVRQYYKDIDSPSGETPDEGPIP